MRSQLGRHTDVRDTCPSAVTFPYSDNGRYLGFILTDGGTALLFWGFIACAAGQTLVYASLAEMASMQGHSNPRGTCMSR